MFLSEEFISRGGDWEDVPSQKTPVVSGVLFIKLVLVLAENVDSSPEMVILCSKIVNEVVSDLLSMFLCIQGDYIGSLPISQLKEMYSCMSSLHGCGTELIVYCSVSVIVYSSVSLNGIARYALSVYSLVGSKGR